jgi:hypothetical protein
MTDYTRKRHLARLRKECICQEDDPILRDVAYGIETAIRRVTERVVGWESLSQIASDVTRRIREERRACRSSSC